MRTMYGIIINKEGFYAELIKRIQLEFVNEEFQEILIFYLL